MIRWGISDRGITEDEGQDIIDDLFCLGVEVILSNGELPQTSLELVNQLRKHEVEPGAHQVIGMAQIMGNMGCFS